LGEESSYITLVLSPWVQGQITPKKRGVAATAQLGVISEREVTVGKELKPRASPRKNAIYPQDENDVEESSFATILRKRESRRHRKQTIRSTISGEGRGASEVQKKNV